MHFSKMSMDICCIFSLYILPLLAGCAFGTREVMLKNTAIADTTLTGNRNHAICFNGLSDARKDSTIGHVQNGYGMRTAEVVALNSIPEWVNIEIINKLTIAGYTVNEQCTPSDDMLAINGKIVKVYTTAYMNYLGEVSINATITSGSMELLNKTYSGYKKEGVNWAASKEVFGNLLESSLKMAIDQLLHDIDSLDNKPSVALNSKEVSADQFPSDSGTSASPKQQVPNNESTVDKSSCPNENGGIAIISGKRNISNIKMALDSVRLELNSVYKDRFELNPSLDGDICIFFSISPEGKTDRITIIQNSLNDKPIEDMLIDFLAKKQFYKIASDKGTSEIIYNLQFKASSARASKNVVIAAVAALAGIALIFSLINLSNAASNL
jgi:hypothetical protein